jgi:hypothetical protein
LDQDRIELLVPPAGWIKARRIKREGMDAMPFDGICVLPGSPLARLLEADRKLTAERRAMARLREKSVLPAIKSARRVAQARASVIVLDLLSDLFHGGHYWVRNTYHDDDGRHCLVGGLGHIRARRGGGDRAGEYLSRAIRDVCGKRQTIIKFNDSRESYAEIRAVILHARKLALQVIVDYAG